MIPADHPLPDQGTRPQPGRRIRVRRHLGTAMILTGVAVLGWGFVVWQWNDPFTSLYTARQQHRLENELERTVGATTVRPLPAGSTPAALSKVVSTEARRFRDQTAEGDAIGRIVVPRLGLNMVLVDGTGHDTLKTGPGRHRRTFMPGEGELVYIAGHRTTYRAPFAHIDRLRPGDRITLTMPYAELSYVVKRSQIVDADQLSVLATHHREELALQACHPRFFATQRYLVWAAPLRITPRGGAPFVPA